MNCSTTTFTAGPCHRVAQYHIETVQAKQGVDQSTVAHKHFGLADQALAHVAAPGWQSAYQHEVTEQVNVASNSLTAVAHGGCEF
jgi:hypothetical protein